MLKQLAQGALVQGGAVRLQHGRGIGQQGVLLKLAHDGVPRLRAAARRVYIFNAHQPTPAVGTGIKPACQRSHERASVQCACG